MLAIFFAKSMMSYSGHESKVNLEGFKELTVLKVNLEGFKELTVLPTLLFRR
jgi:hypothetical protein